MDLICEARELVSYYRGDTDSLILAAEEAALDIDTDLDSGRVTYAFGDGSRLTLYANGSKRTDTPRLDRLAGRAGE